MEVGEELRVRRFVEVLSRDWGVSPPNVVVTTLKDEDTAAEYVPRKKTIYVTPRYVTLKVLLHEFAHHLQYEFGLMDEKTAWKEVTKPYHQRDSEVWADAFADKYHRFYYGLWREVVELPSTPQSNVDRRKVMLCAYTAAILMDYVMAIDTILETTGKSVNADIVTGYTNSLERSINEFSFHLKLTERVCSVKPGMLLSVLEKLKANLQVLKADPKIAGELRIYRYQLSESVKAVFSDLG